MTLPTSGPITLLDIQTEFGGSNPIYLNEYYRGGTYVPAGTSAGTGSFQDAPLTYAAPAQIAASSTIQMSMFRGTSAVVPFVLNVVVSTNTTNFTMRNRAISAGWDQTSPLIMTVTINAGVTVGASDTINSAFRTKLLGNPAFPVGSSLTLINNGTIAGAGGIGGGGAVVASEASVGTGISGNSGGRALQALDPLFVTNNGTIGGGGGGGGGGGALVVITDGKLGISAGYGGGGGGGGQAVLLIANNFGPGGTVAGCDSNTPGDAGTNGTVSTAGLGGAGATAGGSKTAGSGGAGGTLGQPGQPGRSVTGGSLGGAGGAAGPAIEGNANITWGNFGTILGSGWTSPYSLSANVNPVNEGSSVTISLIGTGISGTNVPYTITGVSSADISGAALSGNFVVGTTPTQVITLAADGITEGTETMTVALTPPSGQTSSPLVAVTVNDTSFGAGQVLPSASSTWQIENTTVYPATAQTNIHFRSYGDTEYPNGGVLSGSNWFTVTTPGIGSSYWIRFTVNSGTVPQGSPVNTWISLSIAPSWYIQSTMTIAQNNGGMTLTKQTEFTIDIASNSTGTNIVATHTGNTFYAEQVSSLL